jgi:hypothetical protein
LNLLLQELAALAQLIDAGCAWWQALAGKEQK